MNPAIFREYDIRGVADRDLTDDLVERIARAFGTHLRRKGARTLALSRDCRVHSERIRNAALKGFLATGLEVTDVGLNPTPILYFAPIHLGLDAAVQITGSHNPPQDNGLKMVALGKSVYGQEIQSLRQMVESSDFDLVGGGSVKTEDVLPGYLAHARDRLRMGPRRFKVVVDGGNGSGGPAGVELYQSLGFEVVPLFIEPDGRFPNHHPDPTQEKNLVDLKAAVAREGAELGIAFDGDADRIGVVDPRGRVIWGDQLMILLGRAVLEEVPGATFVGEVKCSQSMYDELEKAGGRAIMWKVGHSLLKTKMKEEHAALAGEMSGHIFFSHRYLGFDDAMYAGARLLELLSRSDRKLAEHVDTLPKMINTPELRVDMPDEVKFEVVKRAVERFRSKYPVVDIDGVRVRFPDGWGLVRASNTQPALVMRFEATTAERLADIQRLVEAEVTAIAGELGVELGKPSQGH